MLVTQDKKVLRNFPRIAQNMAHFTGTSKENIQWCKNTHVYQAWGSIFNIRADSVVSEKWQLFDLILSEYQNTVLP